jgi:AcrR family transcriptional regulator
VDNVTGGRRERKKHATSVALQDAALRLFREQGFAETTVEEIAEAADVSTRTFFRHFHSKEAVLFADDDELLERWIEALRARPRNEPILTVLREASHEMAPAYSDEIGRLRWELGAKERRITSHLMRVGSGWENMVASEVAVRLGLPSSYDLTPRVTAAAASAAWRIAQTRWVRDEGASPLAGHLDAAFDALAELTEPTAIDVRSPQDGEHEDEATTNQKVRPHR